MILDILVKAAQWAFWLGVLVVGNIIFLATINPSIILVVALNLAALDIMYIMLKETRYG